MASASACSASAERMPSKCGKYYERYRWLRRMVQRYVFLNAALSDEVAHAQQRCAQLKEERRFLLKRLFHYQSRADAANFLTAQKAVEEGRRMRLKAKQPVQNEKPCKETTSPEQLFPIRVNQIGHNADGYPLLPAPLGDLTLYEPGHIVFDRSAYHTATLIFPVEFLATRVYASLQNPRFSCIYQCRVKDAGPAPRFEIKSEDNSGLVISGNSPDECHRKLIDAINCVLGQRLLESKANGAVFFGFAHPSVQYLLQMDPSSERLVSYRRKAFEPTLEALPEPGFDDPTISFQTLRQKLAAL